MTKLKTALVIILVALLVAMNIGGIISAYADVSDDIPQTSKEVLDPDISSNENDLDVVVERFTAYLKDKYGADYDFYYNQIIEKWGSIEGYLLSFGNKLPEEYRSGWDKFVGWLGEYAPIWATPLAVILIIIVAVIGKKTFNKVVEKVMNAKLIPIVQEMNAQSTALLSISRGQRALLGNNEKFAGNVNELEASERGLKGE